MDARTLIICFGNPMRGDDGVGLRVAELLREADLGANATVVSTMQLDVALARDLAAAERAIFVDAEPAADDSIEPRVVPMTATPRPDAFRANVHAITPADLLALAERLYGRAPRTTLVAVPAFDFEHGEGLTPEAQRAALTAARVIAALSVGDPP